MRRILILSIFELFAMIIGLLAWFFKPSAILSISIGYGIAVGVAAPILINDIRHALFFEQHKDEIKEHIAKVMSKKLGKEIKPEDISDGGDL